MQSNGPINPLLFLLVINAWRCGQSALNSVEQIEIIDETLDIDIDDLKTKDISLDVSEEKWMSKNLSSTQWEYLMSHPLVCSNVKAPLPKIKDWSSSPVFIVLENEKDCINIVSETKFIRFNWSDEWEDALPAWVVSVIERYPQCQVWMNVHHGVIVSEKSCRQAVQVGWSWWFSPPEATTDLQDYFMASQHLWRFWFVHPLSEQWVWPWCDIVLKDIGVKFGCKDIPKNWIDDQRQKATWTKIEKQSWELLERVCGGAGALQMLILDIKRHLNQTLSSSDANEIRKS